MIFKTLFFFNTLKVVFAGLGLVIALLINRFRDFFLKHSATDFIPRPLSLVLQEEMLFRKTFFKLSFLLLISILIVLTVILFAERFILVVSKNSETASLLGSFLSLFALIFWIISMLFSLAIFFKVKILFEKWRENKPGIAVETYFAIFSVAFFWLFFWLYSWFDSAFNAGWPIIIPLFAWGFLFGVSIKTLFKKGWINLIIGALSLAIAILMVIILIIGLSQLL